MSEPRLIIFSGAGLDAESGVPTFRDSDGLWEGHDVMEVCNMSTWEANYENVHRFYNQRRIDLGTVEPNDAHKFIAEMQAKYGTSRVINLTANVSDLLERAGVQDVIHIHGYLPEIVEDCKYAESAVKHIGYTAYDVEQDRIDARTFDVKTKPNIVFFGEMAPMYEDMSHVLMSMRPKDIFVMVGSTLEINPVHYYAGDAYSILINPSVNMEGIKPLDVAANMVDKTVIKNATSGFESIRELIEEKMDESPSSND